MPSTIYENATSGNMHSLSNYGMFPMVDIKKTTIATIPFRLASDRVLLHIGSTKYLIISGAETPLGSDRIRIVDLGMDPVNKKKLIRLNLQQWVDMVKMITMINEVITKEAEKEGSGICSEDGQRRIHLGGNVFITIKQGMRGLDFRWFWLPPAGEVDFHQQPEAFKVHPTKYGLWLTYAQWDKLVSLRTIIEESIPELRAMKDCPSQHDNQQGRLICCHCNPNGHHVWV